MTRWSCRCGYAANKIISDCQIETVDGVGHWIAVDHGRWAVACIPDVVGQKALSARWIVVPRSRKVRHTTEDAPPKDARRNARHIAVGAANHWPGHVTCGEYLRWLADNGYPLAAVEEVIIGAKTSEGLYSEFCS